MRDDSPSYGELIETLRHIRQCSFEDQRMFWTALRESLTPVADETESDLDRRARLRAATPPVTSLVYYVRFSDRVKIGFTTNLERRLHNLPYDEVLATEVGPVELERQRHAQFADLRIKGEWFRYEDPLVAHIAALR